VLASFGALVGMLSAEIFVIGSATADPSPRLSVSPGPFQNAITLEHVERSEASIDRLEKELEPLTQWNAGRKPDRKPILLNICFPRQRTRTDATTGWKPVGSRVG
jgi:hypothetical protein